MDYTWHVFAINKEWRMFRDDKIMEMTLQPPIVAVDTQKGCFLYEFDSLVTGMTFAEATEAIKKWDSVAPDDVIEKIKAIQEKIKE